MSLYGEFEGLQTFGGYPAAAPGQSFTHTATVENNFPAPLSALGLLTVTLPSELVGAVGTLAFQVPNGQSASLRTDTTVSSGAGPGTVAIAHQTLSAVYTDISSAFTWDPRNQDYRAPASGSRPWFTTIAPAPGWPTAYVLAVLESNDTAAGSSEVSGRIVVYQAGDFISNTFLRADDGSVVKAAAPPAIACATSGICLVAWAEKHATTNFDIYGAIVQPSLTLGPRFAIAEGTGDDLAPTVASDGNNFVVAWERGGELFTRSVSGDGSSLGTALPLDSAPGTNSRVALIWAGRNYVAVWQKNGGGTTGADVWYADVDGNGQPVAGSKRAVAASVADETWPQVAFHPTTGQALVVYLSGGGASVRGRLVHGATVESEMVIGNQPGTNLLRTPRVAFDSTTTTSTSAPGWLVAWNVTDSTSSSAVYQALAPAGTARAPQQSFRYQYYSYLGCTRFSCFPTLVSAEIAAHGTGLACSGARCAIVANIAPWNDPSAARTLFLDRVHLRQVAQETYSRSDTVSLLIDTDQPTSTIRFPATGTYRVPGTIVGIGGEARDPTTAVDHVEVQVDSGNWETTNGRETWSYSLQVPSTEGVHTLSSRAVDLTNQAGAASAPITLVVDGTPPALTSAIPNNRLMTASKNADGLWTLALSGTVTDPQAGSQPGSGVQKVEVLLEPHGGEWQEATLTGGAGSGAGTWTIDYTLPRFDATGKALTSPTGVYAVKVRATDQLGNRTTPTNLLRFTIRVDNTPPDASLTTIGVSPAAATSIIAQPLTIAGVVTDTGSVGAGVQKVEVRFSPADLGVAPGSWRARYFNSSSVTASPAVLIRDDTFLDFDWGSASPGAEVNADNFSAQWIRDAVFRVSGVYSFTLDLDGDATGAIYVDDVQVPLSGSGGHQVGGRHVDGGLHALRVEYTEGSGEARIRFNADLLEADWHPATLAQSGLGVVRTNWSYAVPEEMEGLYAIEVRSTDVLNNRNDNRFTWNKWRGTIDTARPRVSFDVILAGNGDTARTTYRLTANDFNLTEAGFQDPCEGTPGYARERAYYDTDWWNDWFNATDRLYQISTTCTFDGHRSGKPTVTVYDTQGYSTTLFVDVPPAPDKLDLYWSTGQAIKRVDLLSAPSFAPQTLISTGKPYGIFYHRREQRLYWVDQAEVFRRQLDGQDYIYYDPIRFFDTRFESIVPQTVVAGAASPATAPPPARLVLREYLNGYDVYWTQGGSIWTKPLFQGFFSLGLSVNGPSLAADTDLSLYHGEASPNYAVRWYRWDSATGSYSSQCGSDPCSVTGYSGGLGPVHDMVIDPKTRTLFWTEGGAISRVTLPTAAQTAAGAHPPYIVTGLQELGAITVDSLSDKLYFAERTTGKVYRSDLNGTVVETVLSGVDTPVVGLALDSNRSPIADDRAVVTTAGTRVDVINLASDPDDDPLALTIITPPTHGTICGGAAPYGWGYCPNPGFYGTDFFSFKADDLRGGTDTATVFITVNPVITLDATINSPTPGTVLTTLDPLTIRGGAYARDSLKQLILKVDGSTVYTRNWPSPATIEDTWSTTWTPPAGDGTHLLEAIATDWNNQVQSQTHPVEITVATQAPSISIGGGGGATLATLGGPSLAGGVGPEASTGLATLAATTASTIVLNETAAVPGGAVLTGSLSAAARIRSVEVRIDAGAWQAAAVDGTSWRYHWPLPTLPDGATHSVDVRLTDAVARTATASATVVLDLVPPAPVTPTLSLADGTPIVPGATLHSVPNSTLIIEWTASSDGAGLSQYQVGWTESPTPTLSALTTSGPGATRRHEQTVADPTVLWAHVVTQDVNGNRRQQTLGPVYVDSPSTPDLIADLAYHGWMESGASQIGADREIVHRAAVGATISETQKLYLSWDTQALRLAWTGADWSKDGDLFIYLGTGSGGTTTAHNPYAGAQPTIHLPAENQDQLTANYAVYVEDDQTATLLRWNGSAWVAVNSDQLSVNSGDTVHCPLFTDYCSLVTDIYLPFSLLGITDPTAAALKLVAFATEEDGLRLWAAMPDKNPLNSPRVLNPVAAAFAPSDLTLTQHYAWSSLSSGVLPNQGQFVDTDVRVTITPSQPAVQAAYLADQFFGLLTPDQRLDANLDGQPDVSLPQDEQPFPLHAGQTVNYTVVYTNAGTVPATGTVLDLRAYGALRFGGGSTTSVVLPAIAPGGSGTLQFSATADGSAAAGEINAVLTDATHGAYDWVWLLHPVDIAPPEGLAITLPERLAHPSLNIVTGVAHDAAGVPTIELEVKALPSGVTTTITCPQAFPDDGTWSCQWDAGKSTNVDRFELRARATDRFGNVSAWTGPRPVDFDDTPPVVTLEPQVELALLAPSMPQGELLLRGELQDDFQVGELAICVDQSYGPGCSQVTVTSGTGVTGTWASTLLVTEQGDGLTHTLAFYGTDGVGNRMTEPLTRTYTVDTVPPALAVTSVVTTPVASLTGTVSDGGGVSEVYIRVAQPDGTSYSAIARRDGTAWAYTLVPKQAGLHLLTVEAADRAGNISRQEVPITITSVKVTPTILWDNPADIVYGTALSETQLNATAEFNDVRVSGVFAYTPPAGTVLNAGDNQTLHVDFTPDDTANYTGASKDVTINVLKASASITITLDDLTQMYDGTPKAVTVETSPLALSGVTVSYNGSPTAPTDPGEYTVIASLDNLNYWAPDATGTLVIAPREATVTYTGETVIPAGSTLDLAATVVQTSTGTLADLALAQVRYDVKSTDGTLVGTVVGNVDQASASTATLDGLSTNVYVIEVTVVGGYFTSPPESALLAVYDPSGGFVTGGGWIISPPGAYAADPTLTGRANFAFVSKYKKGADVPTGVTSFEFQTAGLKFHSDSYEWLVVAGARAQYKGSGTINGAGDFGFMLTAIDGQIKGGGGSDKFRIKIWDKNNGDTIVYDNQMGDDDDADPTTVIGGGSIVIHAR